MRPVLKPGLRRLWRDATTLQIGVDPERALVVGGLAPSLAAVLDLLDGTRTRAEVLLAAPGDAQQLLGLLDAAGVLDDAARDRSVLAALPAADRERLAPDLASLSLLESAPGAAPLRLARRQASRVQVRGAGRVGAQVAALLTAAGVGSVSVDDDARLRPEDVAPGGLRLDDVGRPRAAATATAFARVTRPRPARGRRAGEPFRPDLVVLAPPTVPVVDLDEPAELERCRVPHLLVGVRETTGVVGPLVLPGRSACLGCQHLHRCDRDPAWPLLLAQLRDTRRDTVRACDVALASVVAGVATLQALALLDGAPAAVPDGRGTPAATGATLELALPDWRLRRRSWPVHPACPCAAATAERETAVG